MKKILFLTGMALASFYLNSCAPTTTTTEAKTQVVKEQRSEDPTGQYQNSQDQASLFLKEQELLKEAAQSCSELSLGEKVSMTYRAMMQERFLWNKRDDCPEFYYQSGDEIKKIFILVRQEYNTSCTAQHPTEITEDKLRVLNGGMPLKTYFLTPVSNGLEFGVRIESPSGPKVGFTVFPDVYRKPEYYEQYALNFDTLEITSCKEASFEECYWLSVEKFFQQFCTGMTVKK